MKSIPMVYKATKTINRNRFDTSTLINTKIARSVEDSENRSAFFILVYLGFFLGQSYLK